MALQIWIADWPVNGWLKLLAMPTLTAAILLPGYHTMLRYTWIGRVLNGTRQPGLQWQAIVSKGAAVMRKRVCPQRHWPSQGSFQSFIARLPKNPAIGNLPGSRIHCAQLEEGTCTLE